MMRYMLPLTDLDEERQITILSGKLFLVDHGNFILLTSPMIFRGGITVSLDGIINTPGGKTRKLQEGEYLSSVLMMV